MSSVALETKNHCAGEDQQQFPGFACTVYSPIVGRQRLSEHVPLDYEEL
jgi:hypothetical protein